MLCPLKNKARPVLAPGSYHKAIVFKLKNKIKKTLNYLPRLSFSLWHKMPKASQCPYVTRCHFIKTLESRLLLQEESCLLWSFHMTFTEQSMRGRRSSMEQFYKTPLQVNRREITHTNVVNNIKILFSIES